MRLPSQSNLQTASERPDSISSAFSQLFVQPVSVMTVPNFSQASVVASSLALLRISDSTVHLHLSGIFSATSFGMVSSETLLAIALTTDKATAHIKNIFFICSSPFVVISGHAYAGSLSFLPRLSYALCQQLVVHIKDRHQKL